MANPAQGTEGRMEMGSLRGFCEDLHPPLNVDQAEIEAARCYFCYDAPCVKVCPTQIDIPSFIRKISTGNLKGAATDILSENIFGGTCARVCPVEVLCEGSCVRTKEESKPVSIGLLQRFATDFVLEKNLKLFARGPRQKKKVAVVGAGPAGLSCAHRLSLLGYDVSIFEAKEKAGGLNEYGLAAYKVVDDFAQKEIRFISEIGGIEIFYGKQLGRELSLASLRSDFGAVFLGLGLSGVNALELEGEKWPGVLNAVDFIAELRQGKNLTVGRNVVVIGGGSTAIDISVAARRLGAEMVTLMYRRGLSEMKATYVEREFAQKEGVLIRTYARPKSLLGSASGIRGIEFVRTSIGSDGQIKDTQEVFQIECNTLFKAIGQILVPEELGDVQEFLEISNGRILVNEDRRTSLKKVYAGGDCINGGKLTVVSVQDGKIAAESIHRELSIQGERNG
jgi:glutamate synthase (NADPH/NADH) small chain